MKKDIKKILFKSFGWISFSLIILGIFLLIQGLTGVARADIDLGSGVETVNYGNVFQFMDENNIKNIFELNKILVEFKNVDLVVDPILNSNGDIVFAASTQYNDVYQLLLNFANGTIAGFGTMLLAIVCGIVSLTSFGLIKAKKD